MRSRVLFAWLGGIGEYRVSCGNRLFLTSLEKQTLPCLLYRYIWFPHMRPYPFSSYPCFPFFCAKHFYALQNDTPHTPPTPHSLALAACRLVCITAAPYVAQHAKVAHPIRVAIEVYGESSPNICRRSQTYLRK